LAISIGVAATEVWLGAISAINGIGVAVQRQIAADPSLQNSDPINTKKRYSDSGGRHE